MDRRSKAGNRRSRAAPMAERLAASPPDGPRPPGSGLNVEGKEYGLGGKSGVDPPVPIPNTEVKRPSADDTAWATGWENRPVPGPYSSHYSRFSDTTIDAGWSSGSSSGS